MSGKASSSSDTTIITPDLLGGFGDAGNVGVGSSGYSAAPLIAEKTREADGPKGHHEPLRTRFLDGGSDAIPEYELLELVLFRAIPRQDTKVEKPLLTSWKQVVDYCHAVMASEQREQFRILFLDKKNRLIADEVQSDGTVDHTPAYVREVVKRALEVSATAILLVHNHPSGDPTPSRADIDMTQMIKSPAKPLGIALHDHIIVGREGHKSFRALGLI